MNLVIASRNGHKIREIRSQLASMHTIDLYSLLDFPHYTPPEEIGKTFAENATLKATHAATHLKIWALGDDSGLVVPALGGAPGLFSARYAGPSASDKENRAKLLKDMSHLEELERCAFFECALALAAADGSLYKCLSATCEGTILNQELGGGGFGYDPVFMKHDYNQTFAQMPEAMKNRISHRAKALSKLRPLLEQIAVGAL